MPDLDALIKFRKDFKQNFRVWVGCNSTCTETNMACDKVLPQKHEVKKQSLEVGFTVFVKMLVR